MENAAAIIYTDGSARVFDGISNASVEILFHPVAERVNAALASAGIEKRLYLFHEGEDDLSVYADGYETGKAAEGIAYLSAADFVKENGNLDFFVTSLDAVFTRESDIAGSYKRHKESDCDITVVASGNRSAFMTEMGLSSFWVKGTFLTSVFEGVDEGVTDPMKFLTYALKVESDAGKTAGTFIAGRNELNMRVTSPEGVVNVNAAARTAEIKKLIKNGVNFIATDGIIIADEAEIAGGTTVLPGTVIKGKCSIGKNCEIGPDCYIENSVVGDNCTVRYAEIVGASVEGGRKVGPFEKI